VRASTASVFTRAAAIAFLCPGMRQVQLDPVGLEQIRRPLPPEPSLETRPAPHPQLPEDARNRLWLVRNPTRQQL
jgi:hypothetical protein